MTRWLKIVGGCLTALCVLSTAAIAADKGGPVVVPPTATTETIPDMWRGGFLEGGMSARFVDKTTGAGIGSAGIGFNTHTFGSPFVGSIFARYGFRVDGDSDAAVLTFDQPLILAVRGGYLLPTAKSTLAYGLLGYSKGKGDDHGLLTGLGLETSFFGLGNIRLAAEYTAQFEDFKANRDVIHNIGLYARLPF